MNDKIYTDDEIKLAAIAGNPAAIQTLIQRFDEAKAFLDRNRITPPVTLGDFRRAHEAYFATPPALAGSQVQAAGNAVQCTLGVGSGNGNLFVVGDYDSIKAAQAWILRAEKAESRLAEIQRGVEGLVQHGHYYDADDVNNVLALLQPQGQADTSGLPG